MRPILCITSCHLRGNYFPIVFMLETTNDQDADDYDTLLISGWCWDNEWLDSSRLEIPGELL